MRLPPEAAQVVARIVKNAAGIAEDRKILGLLLDETASFFSSDRGAIFIYSRRLAALYKVRSLRSGEVWDAATLLSFFHNAKPTLPAEVIMAPVRAGSEVIGVLALEKREGFEPGAGKIATEMLKVAGTILGERRRRKALEVGWGVGGALARGLRPKDAIYRILHGARRLIDYDHGAIVFARVDDYAAEIVAQQVAWAAGKGSLVGKRIAFDWGELPEGIVLAGGEDEGGEDASVRGGAGGGEGEDWSVREVGGEDAEEVSVEGGRVWGAVRGAGEDGAPPKMSSLLVPLRGAQGPVGLLEIASAQRLFFRASDVEVARILAPYLVLCLAGIDSSRAG